MTEDDKQLILRNRAEEVAAERRVSQEAIRRRREGFRDNELDRVARLMAFTAAEIYLMQYPDCPEEESLEAEYRMTRWIFARIKEAWLPELVKTFPLLHKTIGTMLETKAKESGDSP